MFFSGRDSLSKGGPRKIQIEEALSLEEGERDTSTSTRTVAIKTKITRFSVQRILKSAGYLDYAYHTQCFIAFDRAGFKGVEGMQRTAPPHIYVKEGPKPRKKPLRQGMDSMGYYAHCKNFM